MSISAIQSGSSPSASHVEGKAAALRRSTGEFVGDIFYGTLLRQMQKSGFKTKYMSGGRAEEAFQGQLAQVLAKKIGRSGNDPVTNSLFKSIRHRLGLTEDAQSPGAGTEMPVDVGGAA